jgi:hypothetical protein
VATLEQQAAVQRANARTAGATRARLHCRFAPLPIHFIEDLLTCSVPLFLKRQCGRTLGATRCKEAAEMAARQQHEWAAKKEQRLARPA